MNNFLFKFFQINSPYILIEWNFIIGILLYFFYSNLDKKYQQLIWDRIFPIIFFLSLTINVIIKTIIRLGRKKSFFMMLDITNNCLAISFMLITVIAYISRKNAIHRARGFWESVFPIFVVAFQLMGTYYLALYTTFNYIKILYVIGLITSILGIIVNIFALWHLRRSFSIMVEVRELVTTGLYRYIRHPLYFGELIHIGGITLVFNNATSYILFSLLFIMQTTRAFWEERKLTQIHNEYKEYRKRTGFYFPIFWRRWWISSK